MGIFYTCGFEAGSLVAEPPLSLVSPLAGGVVNGSVSLERTIVRTGVGSLKLTPASGATGFWSPQSSPTITGGTQYFRFYFRITTLPASTRTIFGANGVDSYNVRLNSDGALSLYKQDTLIAKGSTLLTDTTRWYKVTLKVAPNSQQLLVDEVSQATDTNATPAGTYCAIGTGPADTVAATYTAYADDFSISDAPIGEGKVVLLVPISDSARSTQWTGGGGGTTNLWQGVKNTPPSGTSAASETNFTQIKHAGGATGSYDANMTAYSTAGIVSGDTINVTCPFIWTGEDSATGDKLLSFLILSNPVGTDSGNFNVARVSGADSTWPTGWWVTRGNSAGAPSTLNSPVMRVTRPETASRVPSVCFMGIYVDYTPAAVASSPKRMDVAILGL